MRLSIVPVGEVPAAVLQEVRSVLDDRFDATVSVESAVDLPPDAFDESRGQYDSETLVQLAEAAGSGEKNLVITPADLFFEDRDYIFGLADFDGSGAAVSFNRLSEQPEDGSTIDVETARARLRKEVVHEVGHLMGHRHCRNERCVMSFSIDVEQIDRKRDEFCRNCQERDLSESGQRVKQPFLE